MDYKIRPISAREVRLLQDFLYEAIFVPEGLSVPPKSIINQPELQVYITGFGTKKDDIGLAAEIDNKPVGAVWVRIMNDYGHIDNDTPSFAISLRYTKSPGQHCQVDPLWTPFVSEAVTFVKLYWSAKSFSGSIPKSVSGIAASASASVYLFT